MMVMKSVVPSDDIALRDDPGHDADSDDDGTVNVHYYGGNDNGDGTITVPAE